MIVFNGLWAWIVFQLASAAVNLIQVRLKYRFYIQFLTSEFQVYFQFNNDNIFQIVFALYILFCGY